MLCALSLYMSGGTYDRFLRNYFMAGLILSEFMPEIFFSIFFIFRFGLEYELGLYVW